MLWVRQEKKALTSRGWGHWIMEKAREFQKNIYFCLIDYAKAFDCVDHNKLWKILSPRGEAEDSAFLSSRDTDLLEPNPVPP